MTIEFGTLCEYAGNDSSGKLNMLGMFPGFEFDQLPAQRHRYYIVVFLKMDECDYESPLELRIRLLDPHGEPTQVDIHIPQSSPPARPEDEESRHRVVFVLEVNGMTFASYGRHKLVVEVNGELTDDIPVHVRRPNSTKPEQRFQEAK